MRDLATLGQRIRHYRAARGLTLEALGDIVGIAGSQLSLMENGRREPRLSLLSSIAETLGVRLADLLDESPPNERAGLEIELVALQRSPIYASLGLPTIRPSRTITDEALTAMVGLHRELARRASEAIATPEEARRANAVLRADMRAADNHFPDLEAVANGLLDAVGYTGGPVSHQTVAEMAQHLGFSLHYVGDLPHSTRSVTDRRNGRIYLPTEPSMSRDSRSPILQAFASHLCGHEEPGNYADFLRQRVETNYLTAAILLPERDAVRVLGEAKQLRRISMEDLRDAFAVSYETAAHRFTNLATRHLGLPVHFMKVHESGTIIKAYENDGVTFPSDVLGAVEGSLVCRNWTARTVFDVEDRFSPWYQYTDMDTGTFWCTSRIEKAKEGEYSVSVGVPFAHVKWFRGRETPHRSTSSCPDERCCRRASPELAERWEGKAWPAARTPTSLLAALPTGSFPGVDSVEVYEFLESHAPRAD